MPRRGTLGLRRYARDAFVGGSRMDHREQLPELDGRLMTCGGRFETWLQHVDGFELHHFCAFALPALSRSSRVFFRVLKET